MMATPTTTDSKPAAGAGAPGLEMVPIKPHHPRHAAPVLGASRPAQGAPSYTSSSSKRQLRQACFWARAASRLQCAD